MELIEQSHKIEHITPNLLELIEECARTCYKSKSKSKTLKSTQRFIERLIISGHHSVIEHGLITVRFITDRGVSHEFVRHRLTAVSMESTRYCNYSKTNDINTPADIKFIKPVDWDRLTDYQIQLYLESCRTVERLYMELIKSKQKPEQARAVLSNMLKTEFVISANPREWRHILTMRTSQAAHPQIRALLIPLLNELIDKYECLFGDLRI